MFPLSVWMIVRQGSVLLAAPHIDLSLMSVASLLSALFPLSAQRFQAVLQLSITKPGAVRLHQRGHAHRWVAHMSFRSGAFFFVMFCFLFFGCMSSLNGNLVKMKTSCLLVRSKIFSFCFWKPVGTRWILCMKRWGLEHHWHKRPRGPVARSLHTETQWELQKHEHVWPGIVFHTL